MMKCNIDPIENIKMLYFLYFYTKTVLLNPWIEFKINNEIYSQYLPQ